jgi:hypothetical protein
MDYSQRITHIKSWFKSEVTKRFSMPKDLDAVTVATDAIEAVNSNLPSNLTPALLTLLLEKTLKDAMRNARSRTLPLPKDFAESAGRASKDAGASLSAPSSDAKGIDTFKVTEGRIRAGQAISDIFLRGTMRKLLLENTSITESDLVPYELAIAAHKQ